MLREFRLPDPGEGLVEAEIVSWQVAVGDPVKVNDILVEIETAKSIVELPSPYAGTVAELLAAAGETVDVGAPIIRIEDGVAGGEPASPTMRNAPTVTDEVAPALPAEEGSPVAPPAGEPAAGTRVPVLVGYGPRTGEARRRPRKGARAPEPAAAEVHEQVAATYSTDAPVSRPTDRREPLHPAAPPAVPDRVRAPARDLPRPGAPAPEPVVTGGAILAKPPVRKLAKDLGVDLATLVGSGAGGVITRFDVAAAAPGAVAPRSGGVEDAGGRYAVVPSHQAPPSSERLDDGDQRIPVKGVRKATAQAMVRSAFTAPHVTEWVTCDVSETMELVSRLRARREFADVRISPLLVISKAVCIALSRNPELNSTWDEDAGEIVLRRSVNLGIAAATPRGLVVPNIKSAESFDLLGLARAINQVVTTAREGRTQPAEMSGGTFTITNVGTFGVDGGTPILNPGEAGILCVGQIARRPWVVGSPPGAGGAEERIEARWVTTLALSFDHRIVDGAQASTFLSTVAQILTDPGLALFF